ncbi:ADOP family duplicated permease [Dyella sp. 20L07]|uniref:ADOP family duplicated permease n=1 Tax=Dyella sp. 20L07 TaxID=3384240 RepID=UPI003D2E94BA
MILRECFGAWRRLIRRPGYAALSVSVLGIGLGVAVFLFSLVNTLILAPLPYPKVDQWVAIGRADDSGNGIGGIDSDQYLRMKDTLHQFGALGAYVPTGISLDTNGGATYYSGTLLNASMMDLLGVKPLLGRNLVPADETPGAEQVVLLSETLWRNIFASDPHIVGRAVQVDGGWATVIGVLPASFAFPDLSQMWMPLRVIPGQHRNLAPLTALLPTTVGMTQAREELDARTDDLQQILPEGQRARRLTIKPFSVSFVSEDMRRWVWLMFGAGAVVLLLACINVANLQLVQTLQRRRELALRTALGSSRARLMTGTLAEGLLLSLASLAVALPIVQEGNRWIVSVYFASAQPSPYLQRFGIDGWVLVFALFAALCSTVLAGVIPAWRASRADLQDALREGSKGSSGGFARAARIMVVAEVALTVVLLVGAGTFVRALSEILVQPMVGASYAGQVLTARVALPQSRYPGDVQRIAFFETVAERLRRDPGVLAATASNTVPSAVLGSHEYVALPGQPRPNDGWPQAQMGIVDAHFLDTYGVRLLEGRFFDARDRADSLAVTVIDRKTAMMMWKDADPVGQQLMLYPGKEWARKVTVIGVIEPLQLDAVLERSLPGMLLPLSQAANQQPMSSVGLAVRTHADAEAYLQRLMSIVRGVDPQVAVYEVYSQSRNMAMGRAGLVVLTQVFAALGLVALLLAGAGLYGVLAFSVTQRTREIGIRRAIGAGNGAILREAGRQLFWQLGIGLGIGLVLAWPWSNILADPGLRTQGHDPAVIVPVCLLVVVVAMLAALMPLRRALRVDPIVALNCE